MERESSIRSMEEHQTSEVGLYHTCTTEEGLSNTTDEGLSND